MMEICGMLEDVLNMWSKPPNVGRSNKVSLKIEFHISSPKETYQIDRYC